MGHGFTAQVLADGIALRCPRTAECPGMTGRGEVPAAVRSGLSDRPFSSRGWCLFCRCLYVVLCCVVVARLDVLLPVRVCHVGSQRSRCPIVMLLPG